MVLQLEVEPDPVHSQGHRIVQRGVELGRGRGRSRPPSEEMPNLVVLDGEVGAGKGCGRRYSDVLAATEIGMATTSKATPTAIARAVYVDLGAEAPCRPDWTHPPRPSHHQVEAQQSVEVGARAPGRQTIRGRLSVCIQHQQSLPGLPYGTPGDRLGRLTARGSHVTPWSTEREEVGRAGRVRRGEACRRSLAVPSADGVHS